MQFAHKAGPDHSARRINGYSSICRRMNKSECRDVPAHLGLSYCILHKDIFASLCIIFKGSGYNLQLLCHI